jgi:hypothetical protein
MAILITMPKRSESRDSTEREQISESEAAELLKKLRKLRDADPAAYRAFMNLVVAMQRAPGVAS